MKVKSEVKVEVDEDTERDPLRVAVDESFTIHFEENMELELKPDFDIEHMTVGNIRSTIQQLIKRNNTLIKQKKNLRNTIENLEEERSKSDEAKRIFEDRVGELEVMTRNQKQTIKELLQSNENCLFSLSIGSEK